MPEICTFPPHQWWDDVSGEVEGGHIRERRKPTLDRSRMTPNDWSSTANAGTPGFRSRDPVPKISNVVRQNPPPPTVANGDPQPIRSGRMRRESNLILRVWSAVEHGAPAQQGCATQRRGPLCRNKGQPGEDMAKWRGGDGEKKWDGHGIIIPFTSGQLFQPRSDHLRGRPSAGVWWDEKAALKRPRSR